ncbi:MBOAT family O-acyltransferase [Caballeronia sp. INDeC2]|uniref:MBOAT family O-acyltransferase n=1 Tax=Caballeronia sp. INDeC2 TaxID=2921747 RepID=UPI0020298590
MTAAAIATNLAVLGYYKYANFFIDSTNHFLGWHLDVLAVLLPLGISFFTFTQIAFLVDVYRGIAREYSFANYLLFVTYFPHLIAGPVLHHKQMMPQFANPDTFRINPHNIAAGLTVFVLGLAKKVLIADNLALAATPLFNAASAGVPLTFFEAWIAAFAYTLQLYFDFSGYCDMAVGISLLFNVKLPINFDSPYQSASIIDFWRRWHMTLSAFLRDYLYIPMGGSRHGGPMRRHANLMITMLLGGLWHGAGWTFVVWGGLHGVYLIINHGWRALASRFGIAHASVPWRLASVALTFIAVVVGWVFFRADKFDTAWNVLAGMAGLHGVSLPFITSVTLPKIAFVALFIGAILVWACPNLQRLLEQHMSVEHPEMHWPAIVIKAKSLLSFVNPSALMAVTSALLLFFVVLAIRSNGPSEFLYFEF